MNEFENTRTLKNLERAFAMEAKKSMEYHYFATNARRDKMVQICEIFSELSGHELEHAKLWYKLANGGVPNTEHNLATAIAREDESEYLRFAQQAREEGFADIAEKFEKAAYTDKLRRDKLTKLLENIRHGAVFQRAEESDWTCSTCGYIHHGTMAPEECPLCEHGRAYYRIPPTNY